LAVALTAEPAARHATGTALISPQRISVALGSPHHLRDQVIFPRFALLRL
jgi:hypothetical protein